VKSNQWVATSAMLQSSTEMGFKVEHKDIECFHCHKKGHITRSCPDKPKKDGGCGGGRGHGGRGGRSGCSGQGRGGRGDGKKPVDPLRVPPKAGESHEKTVNGRKVIWYGRCSFRKDHSTEQHRAMVANTQGTGGATNPQQGSVPQANSGGMGTKRQGNFAEFLQDF